MFKNETQFASIRLFALTVFCAAVGAAVLAAPASAQNRRGPPISPDRVLEQQSISPAPPPPPLQGPPPISAPFAGN